MSSGKRKSVDPLEKAIEAALSPGSFIYYNAAWSFVDNVQSVAADIGKIIHKEPKRAARLYELFIAACHEKADEIDDSNGNFGMLVGDLFCNWIKAHQAANDDPDETANFLLTWMEKELMRYVPVKGKTDWHQKAMEVSEKGDLSAQIELLLNKKEIDRLILRLRRVTDKELEDLSHYRAEPLARKLKRSHPDISARVYRALCIRIVNADWKVVVADVRSRHFRKKAFMSGFEDIVADTPRHVEPPFLERAKTRWPRKLKEPENNTRSILAGFLYINQLSISHKNNHFIH